MKNFKHLFTVLLLLFSVAVNAHDFAVDGIFYYITDESNKTVEVTYRGSSSSEYSNEYTGDVVIPESVTYNGNTYSVTSIGFEAFDDCSGLTSIEIPNSVTSIENDAFYGCSGLTSVVIGNSVTSIGRMAFYGCDGLTSVVIGNSVTSIGTQAFDGCSGLTSIEIPNSVTSIGHHAFYSCDGLTSIEIPNSVTSIGNYAFNDCSGLKAVNISDLSAWCNIDFGNSSANPLYYAKNLYLNGKLVTELVIPDDVTEIKDYAFYNCSGLTSIAIPSSVTSIGNSTFNNCSGLKTVINLSSLTITKGSSGNGYVGYYATKVINAPNGTIEGDFVFGIIDGVNTLAGYLGNDTEIVLPDNYSKGNYAIGEAFRDNTSITSIEIPNSVTSIGDYAFSGCSGLKKVELNCATIDDWFSGYKSIEEVVIGNSVTSIGEEAFYNCTGLTSVVIPNSVTSIGDYAFSGCSGLKKVELNCATIDDWFSGYKSIEEVVIGNSVTSIGEEAFNFCTGLTSVEIGNSVTSIGEWAFYNCYGLTSIEIPNSVTSIGNYAFRDCSGLTGELVIPNSVTSIGDNAFEGCSVLTSVTIGNSVTSIGSDAFEYCSGLTSIVVAEGNAKYDSRENCNAIIEKETNTLLVGCKNTIIPNSVTSIGDDAFYYCRGLTSVVIPNSVTSIGSQAFYNCSGLTSIEIPNSVTSIGSSAFYLCEKLKTVINYSSLKITKGSKDYGYIAYYADIVVAPVTGISLDKETATIIEGETTTLVATIEPSNATDKTVTWASDNEEVATVENGVVTAVKAGTATITATAGDYSASCVVTVEKKVIAVTGITFDKETATIIEGETTTLVATIEPSNATDKTVTWTSDNEEVATVNNSGVVTAVKAGTATITATAGGYSATCVVTVEKKVIAVTGISLNKSTATITEGGTETLTATVEPSDATDKTITWASDNEEVATVNGGVVTAVKAGTATITATAGNYSATCVVTVEKKVVAVTGISLNKTTATITEGGTETLTATVEPSDATDKTITWASDNEEVATVNGGVVTAVKAGTATITATAGGHSASCVVTVKATLKAGINYRIKHNTTGYYMTIVSTEGSNHDAGGVQIKTLDNKELNQVFTLESVAENSFKIKSIKGYYLSSFGSWGYNATVNNSDAAIHQFTEVEKSIYTLEGSLGYIGSNSDNRGGKEHGAWIYSNHDSNAQNIYWVFEPLTAEENKELVSLQTAEAMNALERSIAWGKEIVSSRAAVLSSEEKTSINTAVRTAENEKGNACGDVDEEIARLNALAEAIDNAVEDAIYIWSIDDISNSVCYTVSTEDKGSWYSEESQLNSTNKLGVSYAISNSKQQFAFVKSAKSGKYYLYSVGEDKFVAINGSHTTLTETPEMGIVFLDGTRSAAYPWVVAFDTANGEKQISVSNGYDPGVITSWNNLSDSGNTVRFEKAAAFDAAAALSLVEGYESETTGIEQIDGMVKAVYDLSGRRIVDAEYLEHGAYIINGRKVVK